MSTNPFGSLVDSGDAPAQEQRERRKTSRTVLEKLVYIHLEPDSGAIILDFSEDGVGFHAVAPIRQTGPVHFWFSLQAKRRIDVTAEVAWTDQSKKTGGLRFVAVPAAAREQIRSWLAQSAAPQIAERSQPAPMLSLPAVSEPVTTPVTTPPEPPEMIIVRAPNGYPQAAPAKGNAQAGSAVPSRRSNRKALSPEHASVVRANIRSRFFYGFASGLIVAAVIVTTFSFYRHPAHRSINTSTGRSETEKLASATPDIAGGLPAKTAVSSISPAVDPRSLNPTFWNSEKLLLREISRLKSESEDRGTTVASSHSVTEPTANANAPAHDAKQFGSRIDPVGQNVQTSDRTSSQYAASAGYSSAEAGSHSQSSSDAFANHVQDSSALNTWPEKYIDVGSFKNEAWAEQSADALAKQGYPTELIRKGHLWMSSYHVLVGPYTDDQAGAASERLQDRGYQTRFTK